jgi:LEA14-like dessication related protein
MKTLKQSILLLIAFMLVSCVPFLPQFETPKVSVSSFRVIPGNTIVPTFEIGLHVVNPNRIALKLQGLSYNVDLEGYRVLSGVSNQLPQIEAYGEGDVVLLAKPDLFSTLSLFTDLMNRPRDKFMFNLDAVLDVGGLMPKIHVNKKGEIALVSGNR